MKVYCPTCKEDTLLNDKGICLWCEQRIPKKYVNKAKKEQR